MKLVEAMSSDDSVRQYLSDEAAVKEHIVMVMSEMAKYMPALEMIIDDDSLASKKLTEVVFSAYASGLANGYKDGINGVEVLGG